MRALIWKELRENMWWAILAPAGLLRRRDQDLDRVFTRAAAFDGIADSAKDSLVYPDFEQQKPKIVAESRHAATLRRLGFEVRRELRHMRRGIEVLPGRRESIAAQISLGEG